MTKKLFALDLCLVGLSEKMVHTIMSQLHNSGGLLDSWGVSEMDYAIIEMEDYLKQAREDPEDITLSKLIHS